MRKIVLLCMGCLIMSQSIHAQDNGDTLSFRPFFDEKDVADKKFILSFLDKDSTALSHSYVEPVVYVTTLRGQQRNNLALTNDLRHYIAENLHDTIMCFDKVSVNMSSLTEGFSPYHFLTTIDGCHKVLADEFGNPKILSKGGYVIETNLSNFDAYYMDGDTKVWITLTHPSNDKIWYGDQ